MEVDDIIGLIEEYQTTLLVRGKAGVEINNPLALAEAIVKIRVLILQLVDKVAEHELDYRRNKAARYDRFLKEGMKRSPAVDSLDFEADLIEKKVALERVRGYMKHTDGLVSAVQTLLKVQSSSEKNQY